MIQNIRFHTPLCWHFLFQQRDSFALTSNTGVGFPAKLGPEPSSSWQVRKKVGFSSQCMEKSVLLHPWRLTWNIIMEAWKIIFPSKWVICRFHVNLPGCNRMSWWAFYKNIIPSGESSAEGYVFFVWQMHNSSWFLWRSRCITASL